MSHRYGKGRTHVNWCEDHFKLVAKKEGFEVLRSGWPDYVLVRGEEVIFVEVKPKGQPLWESQEKVLALLERLGLNIKIAINGELSNLVSVLDYKLYLQSTTCTSKVHAQDEGRREAQEKVIAMRGF